MYFSPILLYLGGEGPGFRWTALSGVVKKWEGTMR